jgi:hypothetical protein
MDGEKLDASGGPNALPSGISFGELKTGQTFFVGFGLEGHAIAAHHSRGPLDHLETGAVSHQPRDGLVKLLKVY